MFTLLCFVLISFLFFGFQTLFSILPLTYQVIIDQTCIELDADDCSDSEVCDVSPFCVTNANTHSLSHYLSYFISHYPFIILF